MPNLLAISISKGTKGAVVFPSNFKAITDAVLKNKDTLVIMCARSQEPIIKKQLTAAGIATFPESEIYIFTDEDRNVVDTFVYGMESPYWIHNKDMEEELASFARATGCHDNLHDKINYERFSLGMLHYRYQCASSRTSMDSEKCINLSSYKLHNKRQMSIINQSSQSTADEITEAYTNLFAYKLPWPTSKSLIRYPTPLRDAFIQRMNFLSDYKDGECLRAGYLGDLARQFDLDLRICSAENDVRRSLRVFLAAYRCIKEEVDPFNYWRNDREERVGQIWLFHADKNIPKEIKKTPFHEVVLNGLEDLSVAFQKTLKQINLSAASASAATETNYSPAFLGAPAPVNRTVDLSKTLPAPESDKCCVM